MTWAVAFSCRACGHSVTRFIQPHSELPERCFECEGREFLAQLRERHAISDALLRQVFADDQREAAA
jgi:predicted  nucleic acid-binding Zn-ribbon protein